MNITQILLSATAAILLGALGFSYLSMRDEEAGDVRKQEYSQLLQENANYEVELKRLRSGKPLITPPKLSETPETVTAAKIKEIKAQNQLLREQILQTEKKEQLAKDKAVARNQRSINKHGKHARRERLIKKAMLMAQVKEFAQQDGFYVIVVDVKRPQSVHINTELAIRRGGKIIGSVVISSKNGGATFADPLPTTFSNGEVDIKAGDDLIFSPL